MQEEIRENITDGNIFPTCRANLALSDLSTIKLKVIRVKNKKNKKQTLLHSRSPSLYTSMMKTCMIIISKKNSFSFQMSMKMTSECKRCGLLPRVSRAPSVQVRAGKSANIAQFPSYRPTVGEHSGRIGGFRITAKVLAYLTRSTWKTEMLV